MNVIAREKNFARLAIVVLAASCAVAYVATPAVAAFSLPGDPSSTVANEYKSWIVPAQNIAKTIYLALVIFDLIALAITTLLFRENLGEFFASLSLKVFMGGVFFLLIGYGPDLAKDVIDYFINSSSKFGGDPNVGPATVVVGFLSAAALYFTAAFNATVEGGTLAVGTGGSILGISDIGAALAALISPESFILICQGLALMVTFGAFAIVLQLVIVTIESYLVMSVGTLMIGFAGSRFTFSFSQGYFSYMINVGVKLLMTYIILGVASVAIIPIILTAAAAAIVASSIPYGGSLVAMAPIVLSAGYVILTVGVIYTVPAFTAALLSGQSQSSGSAILQQAVGSFAGAAQMFSQFGAASRQLAESRQAGNAQGEAQQTGSAAALGAGSQNMSPVRQHDSFSQPASAMATQGYAGTTAAGNGGALSNISHSTSSGTGPNLYNNSLTDTPPVNLSTGMGSSNQMLPGVTSSRSLASSTLEQIRDLPSGGAVREAYRITRQSDLSSDQWKALNEFHPDDVRAVDKERMDAGRESARISAAYALNGAVQAAPRDIGQPTAVQIRAANPDKL